MLPCQRPTARALDLVKVAAAALVALATVVAKVGRGRKGVGEIRGGEGE